jgi:hypothetical protein
VAELAELVQREYQAAREVERTGESFEMWRDGTLTQAADPELVLDIDWCLHLRGKSAS